MILMIPYCTYCLYWMIKHDWKSGYDGQADPEDSKGVRSKSRSIFLKYAKEDSYAHRWTPSFDFGIGALEEYRCRILDGSVKIDDTRRLNEDMSKER